MSDGKLKDNSSCRMSSGSQETDSLETRAELAILHTYVEDQAILEPGNQNVNKPKEQGSEDCLWTHIFTFL